MTDTDQSTNTSTVELVTNQRPDILATLKIKEQVFVCAYVDNGGLPYQAAHVMAPHLSTRDAGRTAQRYLKLPHVRLAIEQLRALMTSEPVKMTASSVTPDAEQNPDTDVMTKRQAMRQLVSAMLHSYQLVETCDDVDLPSLRETANKLGITWYRLYNWIRGDPEWPKYQAEIKQAQIMAFQARFERAIVSGRGGKTLQYLAGLLNRIDPPMSIGQKKDEAPPGRLSKVELERTVKAKHLKFVRGVG